MFSYDLLIPWITLAITLVPLLYVQRWIHRHLFGVGYLISRGKQAATLFYYLLLLPGVVLHELSAYLTAGVFNVPSTRFTLYPEAQEDGSLEMGFVQLEEVKNPVFAAFIGAAPLVAGIGVVVLIGNSLLDLPGFFAQLQGGEVSRLGAALGRLTSKPDFLLWTYVLFAVANTMMTNKEDRRAWWFILGGLIALLAFMTIVGMQKFVVAWLSGPIASAFYSLSGVFGTVLVLDCVAAIFIWIVEALLERLTGHRVEYHPTKALPAHAAQAQRPAIQSVFELNLPLPPLPGKITATPAARLTPAPERPAIGAGVPPAGRPAIPAAAGQSAAPSARPALTSGAADAGQPKPPALPARAAAGSASALSGTGSRPAAPAASPGSKPAAPFGQPPKPTSPFGKPASPSTAPGSSSKTAKPGLPFGQPAKPAGPIGRPPASPIGGPPALARPGGPPPSSGSRPPFGAPPRPVETSRPKFGKFDKDSDDVIDADVIDEEDDENGDEPEYVDIDDA
jgi:hypothetical protein